jgi:hypothetical protein
MMLMFTEITWAMYLRIVAALLFIYYTLLILRFYFPQIRASLSSAAPLLGTVQRQDEMTGREDGPAIKENGPVTAPASFTATENGNDYDIIEEIVERVKSVLQHAADSNQETNEVISSFKIIVSDYPTLAKSTFRPSINEFIANESRQSGFSEITQETAEQLWQKA